ncbi:MULTISPECIES: hypothetical protein [unclassified Mesorhizobium]|uniref:DUF6894 family protein n=1 Tax=unclassified Mesorhizobium TaxID=325217 RepID=UPI00112ECBCB|nr:MULTISPECIES: hypothetical protein [unclassified Mesorhizobium]MCA0018803.1 hypothetical protein [Mesorhizobium sp. B264B1A]TPJ37261.1 hypothetical protein FJ437_32425 [Mesorhizobium sp. B2-6-6]TPJ56925.1 hypothetical protein FJ443_30710 [Mesorhizobium sp. B2-6-1]TPL07817.1 hypothetical protein FJ952_29660 [Mesorhizobium sp. B2-4-10]MBZ9985462.1 hypothetical protein [Mesorhizobium sp. BR-1-1-8]
MARFFFDLTENGNVTEDNEGSELPDTETATDEAVKALTEIARETLPHDGNECELAFIIRDEERPIAEAVIRFELRPL